MARARACPSVVLPTPGTPSMSRCPRAKMLTSARRTTSSLPRITRRRAFSSSTALVDTAMAVSGDILWILLSALVDEGVTVVIELRAMSYEPRVLSYEHTTHFRPLGNAVGSEILRQ